MSKATVTFKLLTILLLIGLCASQEPPRIHKLPSYITRAEDFTNDTVLYSFSATHPNGEDIQIHTVGETTENMVYINQTYGNNISVQVVTKSALDRDGDGRGLPGDEQVRLVLKATDVSNNEIFLHTTLYINDVNDNVPHFKGVTYTWKLNELPFLGNETFDNITATDLDKSTNGTAGIRYFMNPTTQSESTAEEYRQTFEMDNKTGRVFLKKALDYETNSYYQFNVTARDRNGASDGKIGEPVDLIIRVLDVQDSPPFFTGQPYKKTIQEHKPLNTDVIKITARDGDSGVSNPVNYTILPGNCSKLFNISHDGDIRTAEEIDRDSGDVKVVDGVCVLIVLVEEENIYDQYCSGNTTATTEVTITVEDINDNAPEFENNTYTAEVQENTPSNVPITLTNAAEINAFDIDQGINARLNLFLEYPNGSVCNDFSVSPQTIQKSGSAFIKVVNQNILDFETIQNITILIIAEESLNTNRSATATILLNIIDMNDNNPQFENSSYSFSVLENSSNNTVVGTITATDKDSDEWGSITYSLSGGNDRFKVDSRNGTIITSCNDCSAELDREKSDIYYLTYTATDNGGRSNSTSLVIHITDVNDNAPEFTRRTYVAFIQENNSSYNSTPVVEVEAHDRDEEGSNNSKIVYQILSEDITANISIDMSSGKLYFVQPVDFEKLSNNLGKINITIEARDLGDPSKAANITAVITVEDMNDNSPTFNTSTFKASVPENTNSTVSSLFQVTSVHAEDKDGTERNNKIQYFIISGAMDHFTINPNTGVVNIQINAVLNREGIPKYNITIMAIDQGFPQLNGSASLLIDILDVNDEIPKFNLSEYKVNIIEDAAKGTFVITCLASDPDTDSDLRYRIVDVSATNEVGAYVNRSLIEEYFIIDPNNGSVYINEPPDREVAKTITLKIQVEDVNATDHKPQLADVSLIVTLLDINDNPPKFESQSYSVSVSENAQNATILLTIKATDVDENRTITYQIIKGTNEPELFYLHPDTGILQKHGPLDREEEPFVVLNVSATDNGVPSMTSYVEVNVTVLDFNDNAPFFVNFTNETHIQENATLDSFVYKVTALDDDTGPNANVTYSFEDNIDKNFEINALDGNITVSGLLDRESKNVYTLRIKAQDNPLNLKEQKTTLKTLTVKLIDVNDNHPQFEKSYYVAIISESEDIYSTVIRILASDGDEENTNNSLVSYSFSNETSPPGLFKINRDTGVVYVNNSLIGNVGSHILGLIAEDYGEPRLKNDTAVVNITVLDFNYNTPYITNLPSENTVKVYECVDVGYTIYHFNYSDDDTGINALADFSISWIDDNYNSTFNMTSDGVLKVIQKLNFNYKKSYVFQVQVTDRGIPKLSSDKVAITIRVLDVDDHLPSFNKTAISFAVNENQPAGAIVDTVTAVDLDHDSVECYYFKDNNTNKIFGIGTNNGSIVTKIPLDYENKTHYSFTVGVKDCSLSGNISECGNVTHIKDPSSQETINVTVRVVDENDNPPVFKVKEISVGMRRKTEVNTTLDISLKTSDYIEDKDTDENGRHAWVFTNAGDIQTSSSLDLQSGVMNCTDKKRHIVCVSRNGSLINNKYYSEDISGYFIVPVSVTDAAGSDTVNVKIFLISDSQILLMTLYGPKEEIAEKKNEILAIYSKVTGYTFVYDWLEDHKTTDGRVETFKTDLYFHIVDSKTEQALSASEALRVVDSNYEKLLQAMQQFQVLQIVSSEKLTAEEDESEKTIYILVAVIAVLTVSVAVIIYVSITTRNTYRRKLKAATVKPHDIPNITEKESSFIPGSNLYSRQSNPLLDADIPEKIEYDNISMGSNNSLDSNGVGEPRRESDNDQIEEKEARIDMILEESDMTMESPLDAALKQYEMENKQNKVDTSSTERVVSPHDIDALAFENTAFVGDFESTEI